MYKHILFATDFSLESRQAENRAIEMAQKFNAQLSIIHVIDYYPNSSLAGIDGPLAQFPDLKHETKRQAQIEMDSCIARIPLELTNNTVLDGSPNNVIAEYSEEIMVDLIILGSHGRHGLGILLGSTANGVLHKANCDVLAVRIND